MTDTLGAGQTLAGGQALYAQDGSYRAVMQTDGNFVAYRNSDNHVVWSAGQGTPGSTVTMQTDGNLVLYSPSHTAQFSTGTAGTGNHVRMQADGNLVLYSAGNLGLWVNGAATGALADTLGAGQTLAGGQALYAQDGSYRAVMQTDGNFVAYRNSDNHVVWSAGQGTPGSTVTMQTDGNLVLYSPSHTAQFSTGTAGTGNHVRMQADGNLVLYSAGNLGLWVNGAATGALADTLSAGQTLAGGQALYAQDGSYRAVMQTDGNFVAYRNSDNHVVWSAGQGTPGSTVTMQTDGNLVLYSPSHTAQFSTGTAGTGNHVRMQSDGNLVVYYGAGSALWSIAGGVVGRLNAAIVDSARSYADGYQGNATTGQCLYWVELVIRGAGGPSITLDGGPANYQAAWTKYATEVPLSQAQPGDIVQWYQDSPYRVHTTIITSNESDPQVRDSNFHTPEDYTVRTGSLSSRMNYEGGSYKVWRIK